MRATKCMVASAQCNDTYESPRKLTFARARRAKIIMCGVDTFLMILIDTNGPITGEQVIGFR